MNAVTTRKLTDLYKKGQSVTITGGPDEGEITVYLQKLNPVENETAVRRANGVRASYILENQRADSPVYLDTLNEIIDYSDQDLMEFAVRDELGRRTEAIEAEWAGDEESEWAKDGYAQSLWDAWNEEGIQERFFVEAGKVPDPEVQRLYDEMQRYNEELQAELDKHLVYIREEFAGYSREKLTSMMMERIAKLQADLAWMIEYRKSEIWLGTRNSKKDRTPYFNSRSEVDELESEVLTQLITAMTALSVDVLQGKGSEEVQPSSNSSESVGLLEVASSSL